MENRTAIVRHLIASGAHVNAHIEPAGSTPLHLALEYAPENVELFDLLLEAKAQANLSDAEGKTVQQQVTCDRKFYPRQYQLLRARTAQGNQLEGIIRMSTGIQYQLREQGLSVMMNKVEKLTQQHEITESNA
jgi:hypothetical protein